MLRASAVWRTASSAIRGVPMRRLRSGTSPRAVGGADHRNRLDNGRPHTVARCSGPPGADRCAVAARTGSARARRLRAGAGRGQDEVPSGSLAAMWRWLRRKSAEVGWRAAVDSLRPHSHSLWQSLDSDRAAAVPPPCSAMVGRAPPPDRARGGRRHCTTGRGRPAARSWPDAIVAAAGTPERYRRRAAPARARSRSRREDLCLCLQLHRAAAFGRRTRAIRCFARLLDAGETRPDQLGIGLEVDEQVPRRRERLWALGPLTKGAIGKSLRFPIFANRRRRSPTISRGS